MNPLLLSITDAAKLISFATATVENWAYGRKTPPPGFPSPIKIGRLLKYRAADLIDWVTQLNAHRSPVTRENESRLCEELPPRRRRGRPSKLQEVHHG